MFYQYSKPENWGLLKSWIKPQKYGEQLNFDKTVQSSGSKKIIDLNFTSLMVSSTVWLYHEIQIQNFVLGLKELFASLVDKHKTEEQ